jgi:hypothetical protein
VRRHRGIEGGAARLGRGPEAVEGDVTDDDELGCRHRTIGLRTPIAAHRSSIVEEPLGNDLAHDLARAATDGEEPRVARGA